MPPPALQAFNHPQRLEHAAVPSCERTLTTTPACLACFPTALAPHTSPHIFPQMSDENPYLLPNVDETQWFKGSHLGTQIQAANWQIVNCTTPANFFHVLRRQVSAGGRERGLITITYAGCPGNSENPCAGVGRGEES